MGYKELEELVNQALQHISNDELPQAESLCWLVLASLQVTNHPLLRLRIENLLARTLGMTNRYQEAITHAEHALRLSHELNNTQEQLRSLTSIGSANNLLANYTEALYYFEQALSLASELEDKSSIANILGYIGNIYRNMVDIPKALEYLTKALALGEELNDRNRIASVQFSIGSSYTHLSEYQVALEWFFKSLSISEEQNNRRHILRTLSGIGSVYTHLADYQNALEYHFKSLAFSEELSDKNMISTTLGNIGNIYINLAKYTIAAEYLHKSVELAEEVGNKNNLATHLSNLGMVYARMEDYTRALDYINRSLEIWKKLNQKNGIAYCLGNLGSIYTSLKQYPKALDFLHQALITGNEAGNIMACIDSLINIGDIYTVQKDYTIALESYHKALEKSEQIGSRSDAASAKGAIGIIYGNKVYSEFNFENAESNMLEALEIFQELGRKLETSRFHRALSDLYRSVHSWEDAYNHLEKATSIDVQIRADEAHRSIIASETQKEITKHENARIKAEHEREIEKLRNEELAEANDRIMIQNQQLENLNREKDEIMGIAAHDLKNPLAGIILTIDFLMKYPDAITPTLFKDSLTSIRKSSMRMKDIISSILSSNAAERGVIQMKIEPVECVEIIKSVIGDYSDQASNKLLKIIAELPQNNVWCSADKSLLQAIFDNLLSNAVKYSPREKQIWVGVTIQPDSLIRCTIRDEGLGLTPQDKEKLFSKFQKLSARPTAGEHSTGLGLSIVKKLVELMGGRVWAESEGKGKGAIFAIEIPAYTMKN